MDAQAPLERVAALTALVRALAAEAVDTPPALDLPSEAISWSTFRAARDGLGASVLWEGSLTPLRELARATVARLRPVAADLGDEDALLGILDVVADGEGAARQRRAHSEGGIRGMLQSLVDDTCSGGTSRAVAEPTRAGPPGSSDDAQAVVRAWLEARGRGDLLGLADLTAADATWDSPVEGLRRGRDAVVESVSAAFSDTDAFSTEVLTLQVRGDRAIALIRNRARRGGSDLDSLQTLFITAGASAVRSVRVAVDDPEAVEEFWAR
jgi:ketosteroid isomerase-like protein